MPRFRGDHPRTYSKYKKKLPYSYALGIFPSLELLSTQPDNVVKVFLHSKSQRNVGVGDIRQICGKNSIPVEYGDEQIRLLSPKENCLGLCVFNKYAAKISSGRDHLLLVNPSNAGNLGTILRTMLAFGFRDLAIISPGVDIFHPTVVRASMGALFHLNWQYFSNLEEYRTLHPNHLYPLMTDGSEEIGNIRCLRPFTLVLGRESSGLDPLFRTKGTTIRIPQSGSVDSLNLAVAAGIALYYVSRDSKTNDDTQ